MPHPARTLRRTLACASCLAVAFVGPTAADEFSDYRIPDHRLLLANANVELDLTQNRTNSYPNADRGASGATFLNTFVSHTWASERRTGWVDGTGQFQGERAHDDATVFLRTEQSHGARANEGAFVSTGWSFDPSRAPVGYDLVVLGGTTWEQTWDARHDHEDQFASDGHYVLESRDDGHRWSETRAAEGRAGFHVGRVRDATAVAEAHLLERRLLKGGVLVRPLGPDARHRLAQLMDVAGDLMAAHDRPAKYVWTEVERILRDDGALRDTSGAGVLAAQEPWVGPGTDTHGLPQSPIGRNVGWRVTPFVAGRHDWGASHQRQQSFMQVTRNDTVLVRSESRFDNTGHIAVDRPALGVRLEAHRPLGEAWQVDGSVEGQRPIDRDRGRSFSVSSAVSLAMVVSDRLLWSVSAYQSRQIDEQFGTLDTWATQIGTTLLFYVEDHVALTLTAASQQQEFDSHNPTHGAYQQRNTVRIGIDYRITRRARAPGLTPV